MEERDYRVSGVLTSIYERYMHCMDVLQCQYVQSLDKFFDVFQKDPVEVAVVCLVATEPVAEISHGTGIVKMLKSNL